MFKVLFGVCFVVLQVVAVHDAWLRFFFALCVRGIAENAVVRIPSSSLLFMPQEADVEPGAPLVCQVGEKNWTWLSHALRYQIWGFFLRVSNPGHPVQYHLKKSFLNF